MTAILSDVSLCLPMAHKEQTVQLGARIRASVKRRAEEFCIRHPMQPSLATIIELALTDYLNREEASLPKPHKPK